MIPNQWYVILDAKEVKKGKPIGFTRLAEKMVAWRDTKGRVSVIADVCAHRGASIALGKVHGDHIACPFHGFRYDDSGKCVMIPANGKEAPVPANFKVKRYEVREEHGFIWLWWGEERKEYPPIKFFENIDGMQYSTKADPWEVHYSRAVENQLDVVHLPFVHHNTIGRGNKTLVNGPVVRLTDNQIDFWVFNEKDEGQQRKDASQLSTENSTIDLHFIFPNIWQNNLGSKYKIVAAFVPIDENNTRVYVRNYQRILRLWPLNHLMMAILDKSGLMILHQDRTVVHTQEPNKTALKMGENLIPGDAPIIQYRKRRQELIDLGK